MTPNPTTEPRWIDFDCVIDMTMDELERLGTDASIHQWYANWNIGDVARIAARRFPSTWQQVFPEWVSPDLIARCKAVAEAYPPKDRHPLASWTIHMRNANRPDRMKVIAEHVAEGRTSDEANAASKGQLAPSREKSAAWLLAVDVNYYLHRFYHSGAGMEAAKGVADWLVRLVDRLKEKGLTDVACCFDAPRNFRKTLTEGWEKPYKPRPPKDDELSGQLNLVRELLEHKFLCVSVETMEADDVMASYAVQFDGRVTLLTQDKDARQCLSEKCNILLDVEWIEDATSGQALPKYKWVTGASHVKDGCTYSSTAVIGIRPEQWPDFQAIAGDNVDGISGVAGIGAAGAMQLIQQHGTLDAVIEAAVNGNAGVSELKTAAILNFARDHAAVTMQLVKMRTDLTVPFTTKLV